MLLAAREKLGLPMVPTVSQPMEKVSSVVVVPTLSHFGGQPIDVTEKVSSWLLTHVSIFFSCDA